METVAAPPPTINLRDVKERVKDLLEPRPGVYWADLLASAGVGWGAFAASLAYPAWSVPHLAWSVVSALALYRGAMFIHEITHLPRTAIPGFQWAFDALIGIPLQLPSFLYAGVHLDHHRKTLYGTPEDPEYLPLASGPRRHIAGFLLQALVIPVLLLARFALLAPLSMLLGPRVRKLVVERASSLAINWRYRREPPPDSLRTRWLVCEGLAAFVSMSVVALTILGRIPAAILGQWLLVSTSVAVVNQLRTIGAHRWRNDGSQMDVAAQFLDSVNTPGPVAALWAPVGLRFHALHHFVPDLPYHALGAAHRRLLRDLPAGSGYTLTLSRGMVDSLRTVWSEAGRGDAAPAGSMRGPTS